MAEALAGVNRKTAAYYFHGLHEVVDQATEDQTPFFGEIAADESYGGAKRKGKPGRGAAGTMPVFSLLKRGGKVYAKVIPKEGLINSKFWAETNQIPSKFHAG